MKCKIYIVVISLLLLFIGTGIWIFNHNLHPENAVIGRWNEVDWVYAKVNGKGKGTNMALNSEERYEIANHLVIHAFEKWTFNPDRTVRFHEKNGSEHIANWSLSGRGHILKFTNPDGSKEVYQIEELSKHKMILHFETNVHARGIVKITFKR